MMKKKKQVEETSKPVQSQKMVNMTNPFAKSKQSKDKPKDVFAELSGLTQKPGKKKTGRGVPGINKRMMK